ncbi:MAG: YdeI/OmpD-associated family protein [Bacteroidales bacterium]
MDPFFFKDQSVFRKWLGENHRSATEVIVGYYKKGSGKASMSWSESVDEALCFGWIDGVRRSIDQDSYCIRFTPRRKGSTWSNVNIEKVKTLTAKGLMHSEGLEAFNNRKEEKSGIYSFENETKELPAEMEDLFKKKKAAWDFFMKQAPSYKRTITNWVLSARREETRKARLEKLIAACMKKERIY